MDYTELVKSLRICGEWKTEVRIPGEPSECDGCSYYDAEMDLCKSWDAPWRKEHLLLDAADAIEKLMRRCEQFQYTPPPAWIPVEEKLPEKYTPVLVCYRSYNTGEPMADCNAYIDNDGDWCWYDGFPASGVIVTVPITHWQPLPEPPKEETE